MVYMGGVGEMILSLQRREIMDENEVKNAEGAGESKSDKFKRLATKRVKNILRIWRSERDLKRRI